TTVYSLFFSSSYSDFCDLYSFPTRRSSDLFYFFLRKVFSKNIDHKLELILTLFFHSHLNPSQEKSTLPKKILGSLPLKPGISYRSEEHTSELQSRFDLVCRLLLEKKK